MTKYDDVKNALRKNEELSKLEEQLKHPAGKFFSEADNKTRKIVYDTLNASGYLPANVSPQTLDDKQIKKTLSDIHSTYSLTAGNIYQANADEVADNIPESDLEILASKPSIFAVSSDKDKKILGAYRAYRSSEELLKKYQAGQITQEESEVIQQIGEQEKRIKLNEATEEAFKKEKARQSAEGYQDPRMQRVLASISATAVGMSENLDPSNREYATEGIRKNTERAKEAYEKTIENNYDAKEAVKTTIKSLANNKDPNRYTIGLSAIYNPDSLDQQQGE